MSDRLVFVYSLVLTVGILGAVGDLILYKWSKSHVTMELVLAICIWVASLLVFAYVLRHGGRSLSIIFVLTAAIHSVIVLLWDMFINNRRATWAETVGMFVAILGVMLIEIANSIQPHPDGSE